MERLLTENLATLILASSNADNHQSIMHRTCRHPVGEAQDARDGNRRGKGQAANLKRAGKPVFDDGASRGTAPGFLRDDLFAQGEERVVGASIPRFRMRCATGCVGARRRSHKNRCCKVSPGTLARPRSAGAGGLGYCDFACLRREDLVKRVRMPLRAAARCLHAVLVQPRADFADA